MGEWYCDKPHGVCWITFKDDKYDDMSFEGIGTFTHGVLHGGPLVVQFKDGWR
jgi:hypothetical protein